MGTYPQSKVADEGGPSRRSRKGRPRKGQTIIFAALDYALAHPEESLVKLGPKNGVGTSTMANWLNPPDRATPNLHLVAWLKKRDPLTIDGSGVTNLVAWEQARPQNTISQRVIQALHVRKPRVKVLPTVEPVEPTVATPDVGHEPLVGPTGIGTFVPVTTDDLLVVREEALRVKAEAEAVALEATVLSLAIDTIRDWLTDKDKLGLALGRIQSLESQLKHADVVVKQFQAAKLAANQIHSKG
jgi:hypothetical protein